MDYDEEKIEKALENEKYSWRTIRGIAAEAKIDREKVSNYISIHGDKVVKSSAVNQRGEQLFSLRSKRRKKSGFFERIASAVKNRGD